MAKIATNTSQLPIADKLVKGQEIITKSTSNPNVPGNSAPLAASSTGQEALTAANAAFEANRQSAKQLIATRDAAQEDWNTAITSLAAFTENATDGIAAKILSTGLDVRSALTPSQPVGQILNVRVSFTGEPGQSKCAGSARPMPRPVW